uniref:Uncharacterized protein n=1 Tax=Nelumbo nucifera TaxID=4432 RepID=A0A822ZPW6_NELNU|nr:TPA_asm: hypothetical protein HUJ06_017219 [Nelumbo nucifera]
MESLLWLRRIGSWYHFQKSSQRRLLAVGLAYSRLNSKVFYIYIYIYDPRPVTVAYSFGRSLLERGGGHWFGFPVPEEATSGCLREETLQLRWCFLGRS